MTEEAQRQSIEYMRRGTVYTLRMLANQLEKLRQNHLQNVQIKKSATKPRENDYSTIEGQRKDYGTVVAHYDLRELGICWKDYCEDHQKLYDEIVETMMNS